MKDRRPPTVSERGWYVVVGDLHNALVNACFEPLSTPPDALKAFRLELDMRLAEADELDVEFARWVLLRMGEISPAANRHVRKVVVVNDEPWAVIALDAWKRDCEGLSANLQPKAYRQGPNYRVLTQMRGYGFGDPIPDDQIDNIAFHLCGDRYRGSDERFPWHLYFEEMLGDDPVRDLSQEDWPARKQAWCQYLLVTRQTRAEDKAGKGASAPVAK